MTGLPTGDPTAAVRAMARAVDATEDAVRLLLGADAVHWTGAGAARYRNLLGDVSHDVRRARRDLADAADAIGDHAAELMRSGATGPAGGAGPSWAAARWPWAPP